MHTDNERTEQNAEGSMESIEDNSEKSLKWLLDIDLDEPEEKLFKLADDERVDTGLTAYEAEVAGRPMFRGNAGADDLDTYVGEEIVISSDGQANDIYAADAPAAESESEAPASESMAIDYSSQGPDRATEQLSAQVDGADVLGLMDDDDIGEQKLVLKRADAHEVVASEQLPPLQNERQVLSEQALAGNTTAAPILDSTDIETDVDAAIEADDEWPESTPVAAELDVSAILGEDEQSFELSGFDSPADSGDFEFLDSTESIQSVESVETTFELPVEELQIVAEAAEETGMGDIMPVSAVAEQEPEITPAVSQVVEELVASVRDLLESQQRPADSVRVEVMLGTESQSVAGWLAEGYEALLSVCERPLASLQELRQMDVDAIYVRLVEVETGSICNTLLAPEVEVATPGQSVGAEGVDGGEVIRVEFETRAAEASEADSIFGEDIFGDDLSLDFPEVSGAASADTDIDALFDSFGDLSAAAEESDEQGLETQPLAVDSTPEVAAVADTQFTSEPEVDSCFAAESRTDIQAAAEPEAIEQPVVARTSETVDEVAAAAISIPAADDPSWCIPEGIEFNYTSQSGAEIFADFLDAFLEEGAEELEKLEDAVGEWERDASADEAFATVTRTLHTIKGIAKGVGLQRYGTLIHNYETLLEALPRPVAGQEQDYFRIVNAWLDAAVRGLDFVRDERADIASELPVQAGETDTRDPEVQQQVVAESNPETQPVQELSDEEREQRRKLDKQLADEGAKVLAAQQSVRITSEKLDHLLNLTNQAQQLGVRTSQSSSRGKRASSELQARLSSVKTQISEIADRSLLSVSSRGDRGKQKLDALEMDQYSELQEAANILREGIEDIADLVDMASRQTVQVEALLKQQASVISSIGSSIQAARVVPVSRLMPGLRRIVRTVSGDLNKSVRFKVLNEVGSLERDDYARCQTILEHMVRNALDHGIETAAQRMSSGKDTSGLISIDVSKSGADYVITLADDGKGIDPQAMRDSVRRKGLDVDVDGLSDEEALRLVFHKGLSTARELSQISGRGVGMDIVLSELQQMGGDIQIKSQVGLGTSFIIRIPANVTVNGALLVTAGDSSYAIPLGGLVAVEQVPVEEFFSAVKQQRSITLSGIECQPAYLAALCSGDNLPDPADLGASLPVIVAGNGARHMAIAIDDVEEALELVIRNLGPQFSSVPGVAGAATTANGAAVVALDLNLLVESAAGIEGTSVAVEKERKDKLRVMVVDDSRTQRMVTTSQLDTVGVESFTAENGQVALDLLNGDQRLPDVILMDVEMPHKDGIEALREIRKSHRYGDIPVIMITSRTGLKHRSLAEEAGCNGYMGKPFNFRMLVAQINELTGHSLQLS